MGNKQTGNIGNTLIVPGASSEARSSCLNDPRTRSVDADSSRTKSDVDAEPCLRSRAVTSGDEPFSFAEHRAARSAIEAFLALIEARQKNRAVVERPHAVVDLLETNRLA